MTGVLFGEVFAFKNMAKVCSAVGALDLRSYSIGVRQSFNGTGNFFVKTRPPAVRLKLIFGPIKRFAAPFADVGSFFPECKVFAGERRLSSFVDYDAFLGWSKVFGLLRRRHKNPLKPMIVHQ